MNAKDKFLKAIEKKVTDAQLEVVTSDHFMYFQVPGKPLTLAVVDTSHTFGPIFNFSIHFGDNIFKDNQISKESAYIEKFSKENRNINEGDRQWFANYADQQGCSKVLSVIDYVLRQVAAPMGPFIPKSIHGAPRHSQNTLSRELKELGLNTEGPDVIPSYVFSLLPQGWKKVLPKEPSSFDIQAFLLDEKGYRRATIHHSEYSSYMTIHSRFVIEQRGHYSGSTCMKASVLDAAVPYGDGATMKEIKTFEYKPNSFNYEDRDAKTQAETWVRGLTPNTDSPLATWNVKI